ncbi:FAD-binding oxidoreductase [Agromyces mariniharenae]|uniref:FAD-binding oxidoreductase n=1 Tax=Agromyces mariniharenae TaxID=2604423 RepID=A0A5S4V598_9MICO|nr:FAD-binding oxidoreductase [Agromyces mariniharenae]TYL53209.1 FAD-binding oxidoreductase [Agromyces mariniharenae]
MDDVMAASLEHPRAGRVVAPSDPDYDELRRVWNGSIDRHPARIVQCATASDVASALQSGRDAGWPIAVRSGGHSFPGHSVCDHGIVIDLRPMKSIEVDPVARIARVGGGVLLGELDAATQRHGLAVPLGSVSHTGVAGLTLGGGFGWLMRRLGLAIDQLVAVELVTAGGAVLRASAEENADLFWAVRGGGGNFGVVTRFEFRLHEVGPYVLSGMLLWPIETAEDVAAFYREWSATAPDELTTALLFRRAPALDIVPRELHGRHVVGVLFCWSGELGEGERVADPIRRFGGAVDLTARRRYVDHQSILDPSFPKGIWIHSKAANVQSLDGSVGDALIASAHDITSPRTCIVAWQLGGAVARVGRSETPFAGRAAGHLVDLLGATDGPDGFERERDWARRAWEMLQPHRSGAYVNWLMDDGRDQVEQAYGREHYERLRQVKRRYDPDNVLRLNQNIPPA